MLALIRCKVLLLLPLLLRLRPAVHLGLCFGFLLFEKLNSSVVFGFDLQHLFELGVRVHVVLIYVLAAVRAFSTFLFVLAAAELDFQRRDFSLFPAAGSLFSFAFL